MPLYSVVLLVVASFLLLPVALAGQTDSVTITDPNPTDGDIDSPGVRILAEIDPTYVEEEFFVEGTADVYNYTAAVGSPGVLMVQTAAVPYKTRMIVRRPANAVDFNGTVVIEWWNSTATFDTAPVWDMSAEYFVRKGIIYVGITNAISSIDFLFDGCSLFGLVDPACGTRYTSLVINDDGQAYDIVSQVANLLKTGAVGTPLPSGFVVDRLFHSGQSQQGGSMVAYASNFHFAPNDGYFIHAASTARRINDLTPCSDGGALPFPDCAGELTGNDRLVRTDLPVPVYRAMTETDVGSVLANGRRQTDSGLFRYYEIAGMAHVTVHKGIVILPGGILGPDPLTLEELCEKELNTSADGPIFGSVVLNAMWDNMEQVVEFGTPSPAGLVLAETAASIDRDVWGNAIGGVRLPQMDVPVATYGPHNTLNPGLPPALEPLGDLFCVLSGTVDPFTQERLDALYPTLGALFDPIDAAADALIVERFLLPEDKEKLLPKVIQMQTLGPVAGTLLGLLLVSLALAAAIRTQRSRG